MLTLWDLLLPGRRAAREEKARPAPKPAKPRPTPRALRHETPAKPAPAKSSSVKPSMQDRYDRMTEQMLAAYGVRVRKWRSGMSGIAWQIRYRDGSMRKLIEAPRPKGPMSAAVFLHEIGHHAIGFNTYKPRCLEEYHAWRFAIEEMQKHQLNITESVHRRMRMSLRYAVAKARRRGLRELPPELHEYDRPVRSPD